jgi:hypothetical protein
MECIDLSMPIYKGAIYGGDMMITRERCRIGVTLMLAVLGVGLCGSAFAGSQTYYEHKRILNVGLLTMESTGYELPDPYIFYIMDVRSDLKPQGWEFVNPLAPPGVKKNEGRLYVGGKLVRPAYWEVRLGDVHVEDLLQYDLLFITNHMPTWFTPSDREALRKLVDAGGIIWMDDCQNMRIQGFQRPGDSGNGSSFFLDLQFWGSGGGARGRAVIVPEQRLHPLLTTPYWLTDRNVQILGDKHVGDYFMCTWSSDAPTMLPPDPRVLTPIVWNVASGRDPFNGGPGLPMVAAGQYGAGFIICTSTDVGCGINDPCGAPGDQGNGGPVCGPNIQLSNTEDLKFAYNVVSWSFSWNAAKKNSRRTGASREDLPSSFKWSFEAGATKLPGMWNGGGEGLVTSSPVMVKGVIFCGGPDGRLYAFDGIPERDLDNDGNPDDGFPDYNEGYPYDLIWWTPQPVAQGGLALSSPLLVSTYDPVPGPISGLPGYRDFVFVVDRGSGTGGGPAIHAFEAFPIDPNTGRLAAVNVERTDFGFPPLSDRGRYSDGVDTLWPYTVPTVPSPAYHDGHLYIAAPSGPIWCFRLPTPEEPYVQGWPFAATTQELVSWSYDFSPTIGYVRDEGTGAVDKVLYVTSRNPGLLARTRQQNPTDLPGSFRAYWLGTRNERLELYRQSATEYLYYSRMYRDPAHSGDHWFSTNGPPEFRIWEPRVWAITPGVKYPELLQILNRDREWNGLVRVDNPGVSTVYADYNYDFVDSLGQMHYRTQLPGLNPNVPDKHVPTTSAVISNDDLVYYGTHDGNVVCVRERYKYPSAAENPENQKFVKWFFPVCARITGGPVVAGDVGQKVVYVTGLDAGGISHVWALKADPSLTINPNLADVSNPGNQYQIADPNSVRVLKNVGDTNEPMSASARQYKRVFSVSSDGVVHIYTMVDNADNQVLTLPSITITFSAVGTPTPQTKTVDFTDQVLLWEAPLPASSTAGPSVLGGKVVVPLDDGRVVWFPENPGPDGPVATFLPVPRAQVVDDAHPPGVGFAAANGLGAVATADGLFVLGSEVTVVADGNRIVEMDQSGRALWACDSTANVVVAGGQLPIYDDPNVTDLSPGHMVRYSTRFSSPRTVVKLANSDYVVADTGNNRVVQLNRAGEEVWVLDRFQDPLRLLPSGSPALLSAPHDFLVWEETTGQSGVDLITATHYLIADTGNYRVLEIVTKYREDGTILDERPAGGPYWDRVLVWLTVPTREGLRQAYTTARRVLVWDSSASQWTPRTVCAVGNVRYPPARATLDPGATRAQSGGSIVEFSDQGEALRAINVMEMPNGDLRELVNPIYVDLYLAGPAAGPGLEMYEWVVVDDGVVYNKCHFAAAGGGLPDRLVAQEGEIYRGFVWITYEPGPNPGDPPVEVVKGPFPFMNVTCARRLGSSKLLVADNGANAVLEMRGPADLDGYGTVEEGDFLVYPRLRIPPNTEPLSAPLFADRTW